MRAGFLVTTVGLASFLLVLSPDVTWLIAIPTFALTGFGMGLAYSPLALIVLREAPADGQGSATSSLSLLDSLGTALGTGVAGAIVAASVRATGQSVSGLAVAFALAVVVGLGGFVLTWRLRTAPAPPTVEGAATPAVDFGSPAPTPAPDRGWRSR